ncbi:MAG: stage II sporulation protein E [Defluviitaleaceae bacterium]|nr:stage II sporulation protein E [Defluviitaleaceae bacterium]
MQITRKQSPVKFNINRRNVAEIALLAGSFFAARGVIFGAASPFALIYIATFLFRGNRFYLAALLSALGLFTNFSTQYSIKYLLAIGLLCIANLLMSLRREAGWDATAFAQAATVTICAAIAGFALIFLRGQGFYEMAITTLESGLIFAMTIVMSKAITCIAPTSNFRRGALSNAELMSVLLLTSVLVVGMADVHIWLVSLRLTAAILLVLLAAGSGGAAISAVCGMLLGFLLNITGFEYIFFAVWLGIGGFAAGLARPHGKIPSLLAFAATSAITALYFDIGLFSWQTLMSFTLTAAIFLALPKRFLSNIHATVSPAGSPQGEYLERVRQQVLSRVYDIAAGYGKLAKIFEKRVITGTHHAPHPITDKLIKTAQENVCLACTRLNICWQDKHKQTWQFMDDMVQKAQKRGKLHLEDAPATFHNNCINLPDFMAHLSSALEIDKLAQEWQQKVVEAKATIYHQFSGLSAVMYEFAVELSTILNFQKEMEDRILQEFTKEKVEVENLIVIENTLGKYEISITRKGRRGQPKCAGQIGEIISRLTGRQMELAEEKYAGRIVHLNYLEREKFYINSGIAKTCKGHATQSGDSFSLVQLRDGRLIAALSDGMGSGQKAKEGSEAAIELLEELMEKGFKKDIAIKLINSALLLKSSEEFFSTLDICVVDLNTGLSEFMKIGASASYLLRDGKAETIGSWTLPVGILETVEIDTCQRYISHGDIIVMVTDGVADSVSNGEDGWLIRILESLTLKNPQDIANHILEEAKRNYAHQIKDDMTVLVLRILNRT